jgi:hypothetical protein
MEGVLHTLSSRGYRGGRFACMLSNIILYIDVYIYIYLSNNNMIVFIYYKYIYVFI